MITDHLRLIRILKDEEFDRIYPDHLRELSARHFTEIEVAIKAAEFLVTKPGLNILDIGCGLGKFCFVASSVTDANYYGVDYREHFIELCKKISCLHHFKRVNFIHADIINIDFSQYNAFYFYNSFLEHTDATAVLDSTIDVSPEKYSIYSNYLRKQFDKLNASTRVVTYHASPDQIPDSFRLVSANFKGLLQCWEKIS